MNLNEVLHRLVDARGPVDEGEVQAFHDAIEADRLGLEDSDEVAKLRAAQADTGLEAQFKDVSDDALMELAADGDDAARRERRRRAVMAGAKPKAPATP